MRMFVSGSFFISFRTRMVQYHFMYRICQLNDKMEKQIINAKQKFPLEPFFFFKKNLT